MQNNIKVSIVIVNYNGKEYLDRCIESILLSETKGLEIIVVDNGSEDGSVEMMSKKYEKANVIFVRLDRNYGPARARNEGVKVSKGEYLSFLDNDTIVHSDWVREAVKLFDKEKNIGIIQCKLLLNKERNKFDYIGDFISQYGFLVQPIQGGEKDEGQFNTSLEILSAKSAGMLMRKDVFKKIGGFDEDYFIYVEETDLGWRTWLIGYKVKYLPTSIVYHEFGTSTVILGDNTSNYNAKYHGTKNYIMTLIKNFGFLNLIKILPIHIFLWLGISVWLIIFKNKVKDALLILRGILWNIKNIRNILEKRYIIQKHRAIREKDLMKIVMRKRSFRYFYNKFVGSKSIGNAKSWS